MTQLLEYVNAEIEKAGNDNVSCLSMDLPDCSGEELFSLLQELKKSGLLTRFRAIELHVKL